MRKNRAWRAFVGAPLVVAATACSPDRPAAPRVPDAPPGSATVSAGADQRAVAGQRLPDPITITVLSVTGRPLSGIRVDWTPLDSGKVDPDHSTTDDAGVARTSWTLGPAAGDHTVLASVSGYGPITIHANADPAPLVINAIRLLSLMTPDSTGQTVHPDYVNITEGPLSGQFLAITPYPYNDPSRENPSFYTSRDLVYWRAPDSATNPVVLPRNGYLSDPDIVYNPATSELWLYYREVWDENKIYLMKSADAVTWSDPQLVAHAPNDQIVSPSVVRRSDTEWLMWSVNAPNGCPSSTTSVELRRSSDGVTWSDPERVTLAQGAYTPWHIDVQWIPAFNEYWAVYNIKSAGNCSTPAVFLATSPDGINWKTYASPVMARGTISDFEDIVYRTTFRYRPETDVVTFWYSGARYDGSRFVWRSAVQRRGRADLFSSIALQPFSAFLWSAPPGRTVPLLMDPP